MMRPKISTITSCYKGERFLPLFLEQLPLQTMFSSLQVVLDHSEPTESEIKLVEDFSLRYPGSIKHIIRDTVVPIYTAWNNCVKEADADLLAIWNIDDLRTPDSLERQYEAFNNPEVGVSYGDFYIVSSFGSRVGDFENRADIEHLQHTRMMRAGPFFMFRKALCDKIGYFDEQLKSSADFDFCVRSAFHTRFHHVSANLGYYLDEGHGASTRPDSLQPVEDFVIGLRYGIYDTLDYTMLPRANVYAVPYMLHQGEWVPVSALVPDYEALLQTRGEALLVEGITKNYLHERCETRARNIRRIARNLLGENIYSLLKKVWRRVNP